MIGIQFLPFRPIHFHIHLIYFLNLLKYTGFKNIDSKFIAEVVLINFKKTSLFAFWGNNVNQFLKLEIVVK